MRSETDHVVPDIPQMTDDELLAAIEFGDDPEEAVALRAMAAQRGLWSAGRAIPGPERQRIAEEGGGKL